jgi:hypothetical protein
MEQKTRNKLFMIAAGLVRATMADYEDDYPKTMPKSVLKKINALNDKLRDYAYELGQIARGEK